MFVKLSISLYFYLFIYLFIYFQNPNQIKLPVPWNSFVVLQHLTQHLWCLICLKDIKISVYQHKNFKLIIYSLDRIRGLRGSVPGPGNKRWFFDQDDTWEGIFPTGRVSEREMSFPTDRAKKKRKKKRGRIIFRVSPGWQNKDKLFKHAEKKNNVSDLSDSKYNVPMKCIFQFLL